MDYWDKQTPEVTHELFICKNLKGSEYQCNVNSYNWSYECLCISVWCLEKRHYKAGDGGGDGLSLFIERYPKEITSGYMECEYFKKKNKVWVARIGKSWKK